ncbi:MAG TPA: glutamate formimidoyltransferase [Candidatus Binatia bacterium]|nr:glutamate formimidoyltransferase [Candidatus Binatia bacterium]
MPEIIECVPNFSDGRHPEVYNNIADAIRAVRGARILDVSSDADHNRTVITFVGNAWAVEEAAFRAIERAAELIDLDQHEGEHPRIGATDVVPFIPVSGVSMEDCVALAHRLGRRVGQELGIAVYMYGRAAMRPEREKLSDIRKGEYENWREEVGKDPARDPDYGPAEPRSWGATVIGARPFLIAYNVYLNTDDVEQANRIARAVRSSSGGLQNVQALGFLVEGQAQVSMNLLNFRRTPIHRVQELVRTEAQNLGLAITHAELIGLAPQQAFIDSANWYLQLQDFASDQLLEQRMAAAAEADDRLENKLPEEFLAALADATPTPGGGSVAALAAALGAALVQMVAGLTIGRKKYADVDENARQLLDSAGQLRYELTSAITEDAAAFDRLFAAYRNKELTEQARKEAIEAATIAAGEVPLRVIHLSKGVATLAANIARVGNVNAATDAAAAGIMTRAAARIAELNVRVNASNLEERSLAEEWIREAARLRQEIDAMVQQIEKVTASRGGY